MTQHSLSWYAVRDKSPPPGAWRLCTEGWRLGSEGWRLGSEGGVDAGRMVGGNRVGCTVRGYDAQYEGTRVRGCDEFVRGYNLPRYENGWQCEGRCATPGYDARSADGWFKSENGASHLRFTGGLPVVYDL